MRRKHVLAVLAAGIAAPIGLAPASAQFFDPPRPPTEVPNRPPARQPPPDTYPPQPPAQQPGMVPPRGSIQSQPLPPPPGAVMAPPQPPAQQGALPRPGQIPPPGGPPLGVAPGQPARPGPDSAAPQPGDEIITDLPSQKIVNPTAVFSGLDKITGRITTFDVAINETVQFGALQVTPRVCYTRPPNEKPNTDAFLEVAEITLQGEVRRIFAGWMFAASPGLHAVEHPIYDVWLTDCKGGDPTTVAGAKPQEPAPPPPPAPRTPAPQKRR